MQADPELETWRRQWQAQDAVLNDLSRRVEHEVRRRRLHFIASLAVTATFGGGTTIWAIASSRAEIVMLAVAVWAFIAIVWTTTLVLDGRGGPSKPASATTAAFLDFAIATCRTRRQAIAASATLYTAFSVFMLTWKYYELAGDMPMDAWTYLTSWRIAAFGGITAGLGVLAVRHRARLDGELKNLLALRRELEGPDSRSA